MYRRGGIGSRGLFLGWFGCLMLFEYSDFVLRIWIRRCGGLLFFVGEKRNPEIYLLCLWPLRLCCLLNSTSDCLNRLIKSVGEYLRIKTKCHQGLLLIPRRHLN